MGALTVALLRCDDVVSMAGWPRVAAALATSHTSRLWHSSVLALPCPPRPQLTAAPWMWWQWRCCGL